MLETAVARFFAVRNFLKSAGDLIAKYSKIYAYVFEKYQIEKWRNNL